MSKGSYLDDTVHFVVSFGSKQIMSRRLKNNTVSVFKKIAVIGIVLLIIISGFTKYSIYKEKKAIEYKISKLKKEVKYLKSKKAALKDYKEIINNHLGYESN